ncbi:MAG: hypothetical protein ACI9WU_005500 [Myxococcota bacterium]
MVKRALAVTLAIVISGCVAQYDDLPTAIMLVSDSTGPGTTAGGTTEGGTAGATDADGAPDVSPDTSSDTSDVQPPDDVAEDTLTGEEVNVPPDVAEPDVTPDTGAPTLDQDSDGILDEMDNCPSVVNPDQLDHDDDDSGDACDEDDDNDGWPDDEDCQPLDALVSPNALEVCDGADNNCDGKIDVEPAADCPTEGVCAEGVPTSCVEGVPLCDTTQIEGWCPYELCDEVDNDCDGALNESDFDICCDCDFADGMPPWYVTCDPQAADPDDDDDGVPDPDDNCPLTANPEQTNSDEDAQGDVCDDDDDDDGDPDETDCSPLDSSISALAVEVCNGVDDDCNAEIDDGIPDATCGTGDCEITVDTCVEGVTQLCIPPTPMHEDETCDGLDNNCDGQTDEAIPPIPCGLGPCATQVDGCVAGEVPICSPLDVATPEACDLLDNDCDGETDEALGQTGCGQGPCANSVQNCVAGVVQSCNPLPAPPSSCDAPPAYCKETTQGTDVCGIPCTKNGPPQCFIVHNACTTSGPGTPTDAPTCSTPKGNWDCGLSCQEWPNSLGADCTYCWNTHCQPASGQDEAQFGCNNYPVPPTQ